MKRSLLALSAIAAQKSYANGPYGFVWASSESGERGAGLIEWTLRGDA